MAHAHLDLFCARVMLHWALLGSLFIRQILWILCLVCLWTLMCHQFGRILFFLFLRAPNVIDGLDLNVTSPFTFFRYSLYSMLLSHELFFDRFMTCFIIWNQLVAWISAWSVIIDGHFLIWWLIRPIANSAVLFTWISGLGGNILLIGLLPFLSSLIGFLAAIKMIGFVRDVLNSHWLECSHCRLFTFFIKSFAHFWLLRRELLMFTDDSQLSSIHLSCLSLVVG